MFLMRNIPNTDFENPHTKHALPTSKAGNAAKRVLDRIEIIGDSLAG
jgi:hypothetical protein